MYAWYFKVFEVEFQVNNNKLCFLYFKGYGSHFYGLNEYYEGEWYGGKRSGWGRMYYADGTIYEGEWYDDMRSGQGMLRLGKDLCNFRFCL